MNKEKSQNKANSANKKSNNAKKNKEKGKTILKNILNSEGKSHPVNLAFNIFSKKISDIVGNAWTFILALLVVVIWALSGHIFHYSDTWQLVINTGTTIITFLVVFLIQNTQNRDTKILNLKIDELILAKKGANNHVIDLDALSDIELMELEKAYLKICKKISQ